MPGPAARSALRDGSAPLLRAPRRRGQGVHALLLALLLAGCMQEQAPPGGDPPPAGPDAPPVPPRPPGEVPVDHADCHGVEVLASAPGRQLRAHVPADFDLADEALVAFGAFRCGDAVGRAFLAIQVTPRDDALLSPRAQNYFWEPEHYLDPASAIAAAFNATNATWLPADVAASVGALASGFDTASANATYSFAAGATGADGTSGTVATFLVPFREYSAAAGGYAYLDAGFGGSDGVSGVAPGTWTASGDGVARQVLGASGTRPAIMMSGLDYTDAVVGFVARP